MPAMGRGERRWQRPGHWLDARPQGPTAEPAPSEEGQVLSLCKHRPKSSTTKVHSAGGSPGPGTADGTLPFAAVKARILCAASSEGQSRLRGTSCPRSGCCSTVGPACCIPPLVCASLLPPLRDALLPLAADPLCSANPTPLPTLHPKCPHRNAVSLCTAERQARQLLSVR